MQTQIITAILAVVFVPLVLYGYVWLGEWIVARLPARIGKRMRPYVWVFPAVAFATVFMVLPTINTVILSFQNKNSTKWVGFDNYVYFFTNPDTLSSLKNNVLWLVFFTGFVVFFGLIFSVIFDRIRYETIAKTAVFLPLPISMVAASIIWKFMFEYQPVGATQTGTLNAMIGTVGFSPVAWLVNQTTNNGALIFVGVWIQTGFAMVIISASLKAISPELLEAARVDGAGELRILRSIIVPLLMPTLTVVATTMMIFSLKVFDIVYTMTGGAYDTDVIARQLIGQISTGSPQFGRAAAVGVVLLIAVVPILVVNLRRFRQQEELR